MGFGFLPCGNFCHRHIGIERKVETIQRTRIWGSFGLGAYDILPLYKDIGMKKKVETTQSARIWVPGLPRNAIMILPVLEASTKGSGWDEPLPHPKPRTCEPNLKSGTLNPKF